mmetsp:Transcript_21267/g.49252  ORF Transcript_21267/g.49252 Transcript_21267/m.49252 type:complete len:117 (-) Transcript_21267:1655-2005(-)
MRSSVNDARSIPKPCTLVVERVTGHRHTILAKTMTKDSQRHKPTRSMTQGSGRLGKSFVVVAKGSCGSLCCLMTMMGAEKSLFATTKSLSLARDTVTHQLLVCLFNNQSSKKRREH